MTPPLRTAVIGFGLAGRVFHCPFIAAVPGLELSAIVQRHGDDAGRAYPHARILRSPEAAFADPAIDLIVVGTPNNTHVPFATQALRAGKHVVVDKPVASSTEEIRRLRDLATEHDRLLMPFHNRRFDGDFRTLQKLLEDGTLGRVVEIDSRFDRFRPIPKPNSWKESVGPDHGILFDLGPHVVDQALALFGMPARVTASVRACREHSEVPDAFDLVLEYDGTRAPGLRFTCGATLIAAEPRPRFRVNGTLGSYTKYGVDPQEPVIVDTPRRPPAMGAEEVWLQESEERWGQLTVAPDGHVPGDRKHSVLPTLPGDYRLFYANVRDAIRGDAGLIITADDALRTAEILEAAVRSSDGGRTETVHDRS